MNAKTQEKVTALCEQVELYQQRLFSNLSSIANAKSKTTLDFALEKAFYHCNTIKGYVNLINKELNNEKH